MKRLQDNKYKRGGPRAYRRHVPAVAIDSPIKTLPQNMPLDYFDPTFFNGLEYQTQQLCMDGLIAIPKDPKTWFTHSMEERLGDEDFIEYHKDVLDKYIFVDTDESTLSMDVGTH